jgi:choline dehydrogenase
MACVDEDQRNDAEAIQAAVLGLFHMALDEMRGVDAHLRVKGIEGFRIIDASIMPNIVSGNTNAPTIALADRGVDLFLADRRA